MDDATLSNQTKFSAHSLELEKPHARNLAAIRLSFLSAYLSGCSSTGPAGSLSGISLTDLNSYSFLKYVRLHSNRTIPLNKNRRIVSRMRRIVALFCNLLTQGVRRARRSIFAARLDAMRPRRSILIAFPPGKSSDRSLEQIAIAPRSKTLGLLEKFASWDLRATVVGYSITRNGD